MPRVARRKSSESMYHVMCRSISEIDLYQSDDDKEYYISLIKKYTDKYKCSVYAYCMMSNHMHLFINPHGFDISTFMHCLNNAYVRYFNRKYERHGHLFQGRFASTIVDSDLYAFTLSAYIHNNSKDISGFAGKEHTYKYSSYGIYLGIARDIYDLVDKKFIMDQFSINSQKAVEKYREFVATMKDTGVWNKVDSDIVEAYVKNEYRDEKKVIARDLEPKELIGKLIDVFDGEIEEGDIRNKFNRKSAKYRAFVAYVIRILCGYSYKGICEFIGNISMSGVTNLSNKGFYLTKQDRRFKEAFNRILCLT